MTTYQGSINGITSQTLQGIPGAGPSGPSNWVANGFNRSELQAYTDYYAATGSEASGSTIKMFPLLDPGIMILYSVLTVVGTLTNGGANITLALGDLDSASRYYAAANAALGPTLIPTKLASGGPYVIGSNPTTPTATDTDAQITILTGTSGAGNSLNSNNIIGLTTVYAVT